MQTHAGCDHTRWQVLWARDPSNETGYSQVVGGDVLGLRHHGEKLLEANLCAHGAAPDRHPTLRTRAAIRDLHGQPRALHVVHGVGEPPPRRPRDGLQAARRLRGDLGGGAVAAAAARPCQECPACRQAQWPEVLGVLPNGPMLGHRGVTRFESLGLGSEFAAEEGACFRVVELPAEHCQCCHCRAVRPLRARAPRCSEQSLCA
mmetsp:Transcript_108259/g.272322  ORF Transcript_108259/g.272322 Transcript_108259/m.272322 type:complete len:204 (-) Transcript_108259:191-802(-)